MRICLNFGVLVAMQRASRKEKMSKELEKVKAEVSNVIHYLMVKIAGRTNTLGRFPLFVDEDYRRVEDMLDNAFTTLEATIQDSCASAGTGNITNPGLNPEAAPLPPKDQKREV